MGTGRDVAATTVRLRADIAYDGSAFSGWAEQPDRRTVCGILRAAFELVLQRPVTIVVAGRTDAGVHARGQVAHVDVPEDALAALAARARSRQAGAGVTRSRRDATGRGPAAGIASHTAGPAVVRQLGVRVASVLRRDPDVRLQGLRIAPADFDARFSAVWREYQYRVVDDPSRFDPLTRSFTHLVSEPLGIQAMNELGGALLGLHDWRSFCRPRAGATTVRELQRFEWGRDEDGVLIATVRADAFCHHMVRRLVGAAIEVGRGGLGLGDVLEIRAARADTNRYRMAPARGLVLVGVGYPSASELAARALRTRDRRRPTD